MTTLIEAVKLAERTPHFDLVGAIDHTYDQQKLSDVMPVESDTFIYTDIHACFTETQPDVLIDLTTPEIGKVHTKIALEHGVRPVVGTTGFSEADLKAVQANTVLLRSSCSWENFFFIRMSLLLFFTDF